MTKTNYKTTIAAIAALTLIECVALYKGINGTILTGVLVVIAGLAGYAAPQPKFLK